MSIQRAVSRAYNVSMERKYDVVYWCIDLHGTVLEANYNSNEFNFLVPEQTIPALQLIASLPETRIILWSGINDSDKTQILKLFADHNIRVDWVNENPDVPSIGTGDFSKKFYFSILVDDKAGFDYHDWKRVAEHAWLKSQELHQFLEDNK